MPADPDMRVGVFLRTSLHPRTLPRAPISATVTRNNETVTHMPHQPPHNAHRETGSVTAEFAVLLPAVVLLILIVLAAALISRADISVHTAARTTARAVSVGLDPPATPHTTTHITRHGGWVTVHAQRHITFAGIPLPALSVDATATTLDEVALGAPQ
ncbi:TadE family protein [Jonesia denitrificans DSM 20603]|uniref:TadE family protein n=2 Tax=Jonesia TaxID=43673 RepID=C7R1M3_JONDD|nr:TadE family protein [Jonesia denitrificans DSM 20603]ASE08950.1 pilus assembly protein [Jonesia denitrificans]SQH22527.1 TadE-like protein [Jonesia denitrificans]